MTLDPTTLSKLVMTGTAFAAAFLAALWLSIIIWTYRDIRKRSNDAFLKILSTLVVTILFLPGVLIYFILRPPQTLDEEYQMTLEEEALLQTIEDRPLCPGCGRQVNERWTVCPNCHTRLKKQCLKCNELMELPWDLCPFCGTPAPGKRRENLSINEALKSISVEDEETF